MSASLSSLIKQAKAIVKKPRVEYDDHCPHCDHQFHEKGYPRAKFTGQSTEEWKALMDSGDYDEVCPNCDGIVDQRELTDEEIDSPWMAYPGSKERALKRREIQRARKAAREGQEKKAGAKTIQDAMREHEHILNTCPECGGVSKCKCGDCKRVHTAGVCDKCQTKAKGDDIYIDHEAGGMIKSLGWEKKASKMAPYAAFDFDGTIATRPKGKFDIKKVGEPIKATLDKLREHIKDGDTVKILTARAGTPGHKKPIHDFLQKLGLPKLAITDRKTPGMTILYDDKAVSVQPDTGVMKRASMGDITFDDWAQMQAGQRLHDLWAMARKGPGFNLEQMAEKYPDSTVPIWDKGKKNTVGFYTRERSNGGNPMMGEIFIDPAHRRQGHGYAAAKAFKDANPKMVWFSHGDNEPSINLAKKLGLEQQEGKDLLPGNVMYGERKPEAARRAMGKIQAILASEGLDLDSAQDLSKQAATAQDDSLPIQRLLQKFKARLAKDKLDYFIVAGRPGGQGASVFSATGPGGAARNARNAHMEWERGQGIDSEHDWSKTAALTSGERWSRLCERRGQCEVCRKPNRPENMQCTCQEKQAASRDHLPFRERAEALLLDGDQLIAKPAQGSDGGVFLHVPGGGIDPGETPAQALAREMMEEAGASAKGLRRHGTASNVWPESFATIGPRANDKYQKFQGSKTHVYSGLLHSLDTPTSAEGDAMQGERRMPIADAMEIVRNQIKNPGQDSHGQMLAHRQLQMRALRRLIRLSTAGTEKAASIPSIPVIRKAMTDAGLPRDVRFFLGKHKATACYGDWHDGEILDAGNKLGKKLFGKDYEVPDATEIGRPDWATEDVNSKTEGKDVIHECKHAICDGCGKVINYCKDSTDGEHDPKVVKHIKSCKSCAMAAEEAKPMAGRAALMRMLGKTASAPFGYLTGDVVFEKEAGIAADLRKARNATHTHPTPAQAAAGNYRHGRLVFKGLKIALENPAGTTRRGVDKTGTPWESLMLSDYGFFEKTRARDNDPVDVFIGPDHDSDFVVVVDQYEGDKFDESKIIVGCKSKEQGEKIYLAHYPKGWKLGNVSTTTVHQLKEWLKDGDHHLPFSGQLLKAALAQ